MLKRNGYRTDNFFGDPERWIWIAFLIGVIAVAAYQVWGRTIFWPGLASW